MSDLIERLRAVEPSRDFSDCSADCGVTNYYRNPDGPEAAEELERLYARIAELEGVLRGIAGAIRLGAESDVIAWASLAKAMQHEAFSALTNSGAPDDEG